MRRTTEQWEQLLDGPTEGPDDHLAADTLEYKVETLYNGHWREPNVYADYYWTTDRDWALESLAGWQAQYPDEKFRLVCRRVSQLWEVTNE